MKLTKYIIPVVAGLLALSCDEKLPDINKSPNAITSANAGPMLTSGQANWAIVLEANFNEQDALFAQYIAGGPGVAIIDDERYFFEAANYNGEWSTSYSQALSDLKFVMDNGNKAQAAAADVLSVMIWQHLVDHYGDIPYSEALRGQIEDGGIQSPVYDDAQTIYNDLEVRLDESLFTLDSIWNVAEPDAEIGDEDIMYGGDLEGWIRFANSLKLKLLMRQSLVNAATVGPKVIDLIDNGIFIESVGDMALVEFDGAAGSNFNPQYARREAGVGQFYVASLASVDVMEAYNDPRLDVLYDEAEATGTIVGLKQGNIDDEIAPKPQDFSYPSSVAYAVDNDVILMSHWEVMFLRAEAALRFATSDDDMTMYQNAIAAHFSYIGAGGVGAYLAEEEVDYTGTDAALSNKIGVQKWISMNGLQESEGWIETRRFDIATGDPATAHIFYDQIFYTPTRTVLADGVFPTIRLYPQSELSYNANTPAGRLTTERVFWDAN